MSNTRRGHDTERRCAQELEEQGYETFRSAASKGTWDVIAIGPLDILLIQCKRTKQNIPSRAAPKNTLDEMECALAPDGVVRRQLWCWVDLKGWVITEV